MYTRTAAAGLAGLLAGAVQAQSYTLTNSYDATNFFSEFDFFTQPDPTNGFVTYVDQGTAQANGLANYTNNQIYMGVDYTTMNPGGSGRDSVRVTSQASFTHGLFIADIAHMPGSICGVWPAWWLTGPNWPSSGEIDIIEGVNTDTTDDITLHTSAGCTIDNSGSAAGTSLTGGDCNANTAYTGCGQTTSDNTNYGDGFNDNGGGVYAMEWTSDAISVWFFGRQSIPSDISSGSPDPTGWGSPTAVFNGGSGCDIDSHFQNNQIVFDTTFCGSWAGAVWSSNSECAALADTCNDYVAGNPSAFQNAYWLVNSVNVYSNGQ